jgi:hypothetical protein
MMMSILVLCNHSIYTYILYILVAGVMTSINYFSSCYTLDGMFTAATLLAVLYLLCIIIIIDLMKLTEYNGTPLHLQIILLDTAE